tara:strand:+ start:118 stop:2571 length:2454 start_codon:yes stop_codon:yes gene_type:complete
MSGIFGASHLFFSGKSDFYEYLVNDSLRFDDGSTANLSKTLGSSGNRKIWTFSVWVKHSALTSTFPVFLGSFVNTQNYGLIRFDSSGKINIVSKIADANGINLSTTALHRDVGSWYNIVVAVDTTQSTNTNRVKLYVNGNQITDFSTSTYPSQDYSTIFNYNILHYIGRYGGSTTGNFDGYMAQVHFIDGQQLNPTSFGETKSGVWIPIEYTGSYGSNGFRLEFEDSSDIGNDTSGNNNDFTPTNVTTHDVVPDSPTNNFATLSALSNSGMTLSEGSLRVTTGSTTLVICSTMAVNASGQKFYFEARANSVGNGTAIGIVKASVGGTRNYSYAQTGSIYYSGTSGAIFSNITGATEVSGASYTDSDVIGVAVDGVNGTVQFFKNGVSQGTVTEATIGTEDYLAYFVNASTSGSSAVQFNFGQDSTFSGLESVASNADENGIGAFHESVPSGFLALCTKNFAEPSITPLDDDLPEDYFDTQLWTGNGSSQSISSYQFAPDWIWIKERNSSSSHYVVDRVRGLNATLQTNSGGVEFENTVNVTSFDSNGFTLGSGGTTNQNNNTFVGWSWLAGGASSSNSAGDITSTVSANTEAGFSIVGYTGDGTSATRTIGCGLTKKPDMVILKNRTEDNVTDAWFVWQKSFGTASPSKYMTLFNTDTVAASNVFVDSSFSDNNGNALFAVAGSYNGVNKTGTTYITYCFHEVDGYSKFDSYQGNGLDDGTFVFTGFRPAWVMLKRSSSGVNASWVILDKERDPINPTSRGIFPNSTTTEASSTLRNVDFLSNGFKLRTDHNNINGGGGIYIYMAFAEMPVKYSNAR